MENPNILKVVTIDGKEYIQTTNHNNNPYTPAFWNMRIKLVPKEEFETYRRLFVPTQTNWWK